MKDGLDEGRCLANTDPPKRQCVSLSVPLGRRASADEFGDDSEEQGRCPKAANTPPAGNVPAACPQVGAAPSADKIAKHVNHVKPAPRTRIGCVDSGWVGDMTALHP